jgi:tetratricopeptide (TPR) repeat protein
VECLERVPIRAGLSWHQITLCAVSLGLFILASSVCLAADDPEALNQRVYKLFAEGKYQEAIPLAEKAVELTRRDYGPEGAGTALPLNNLGSLFNRIGAYAKAEPLLQEALRICQKVLGPEHAGTVSSLNNLGTLYCDMGEYAKAEPLSEEALRIRQKILGPDHPDTFDIEIAPPRSNSQRIQYSHRLRL